MRLTALLCLIALLCLVAGTFAGDFLPMCVIPIDADTGIRAQFISVYKETSPTPASFGIPGTRATIKNSKTPVKSTHQVWSHGRVSYFHGIPVGNIAGNIFYGASYPPGDSGFLVPGVLPAIDAIYNADPAYVRDFQAKHPSLPINWMAEYSNAYKARWEALYVPSAILFGTDMGKSIIFTLRIETFEGVDPIPAPVERRDGTVVIATP